MLGREAVFHGRLFFMFLLLCTYLRSLRRCMNLIPAESDFARMKGDSYRRFLDVLWLDFSASFGSS